MLNEMNKHINHMFTKKQLINIEAKEHGQTQTSAQLLRTEKREHRLKKTPTLREAMFAEYAEHHNEEGKLITKPTRAQEARASRIYRGK